MWGGGGTKVTFKVVIRGIKLCLSHRQSGTMPVVVGFNYKFPQSGDKAIEPI